MEKPKLDWKTFSLRRRLDVPAWLRSLKIKNYGELKKWCESKDMVPPEKAEVSEHFKVPKPKKVEPKVEEPKTESEPVKEEPKPAPKTTTRKRRTKKVVDLED